MRIPRNHLLVSSLVALLEERQNQVFGSGGGDAALRQLAEMYAMDVEKLESIARSVNVPRVREGGVRHIRDAQSGEETIISEVSFSLFHRARSMLNASPRSRGRNRYPRCSLESLHAALLVICFFFYCSTGG